MLPRRGIDTRKIVRCMVLRQTDTVRGWSSSPSKFALRPPTPRRPRARPRALPRSGYVENVSYNLRTGARIRFARHRWDPVGDRSNRMWTLLFRPERSRKWEGAWFRATAEMPRAASADLGMGSRVTAQYLTTPCCVCGDVPLSRSVRAGWPSARGQR